MILEASIYTPSVLEGLARGRASLNDCIGVLEHGTAEQIAKFDWLRGASIRCDITRARAAFELWLEDNQWKFIGTQGGQPW